MKQTSAQAEKALTARAGRESRALQLLDSPTLMTWASLGVRVGGFLLLLPLALTVFDAPTFSLWMLLHLLVSMQQMLDFGFTPTFVRLIAYQRADRAQRPAHATRAAGSEQDRGAVLAAMGMVYRGLGVLAFVLLLAAGAPSLVRPVAALADPDVGWLAAAVVLSTAPITLALGRWGAVLQGLERIALLRRWEAAFGGVALAAAAVALWAGAGLVAVVALMQGGSLLGSLVTRALARRALGPLDCADRKAARQVLRSIWPVTWRSGVGVLAVVGTTQASGVVYAQLGDPASVAGYLFALRMLRTVRDFANAPFYTRLPRLARLWAEGDRAAMLRTARAGMLSVNWLFTGAAAAIGLLGPAAMTAIGASVPFPADGIWWLLALALLAERIGALHIQLYSSSNHILWHVANGITGALMIPSMAIGYVVLGVAGLPIGMLFAYLCFYVPYALSLSYRAFGLRPGNIDLAASVAPAMLLAALLLWA